MMKLKYLFHNEALLEMIIANWRHDENSSELFKFFRISSNAVYPFRQDGRICFLRFAPVEEKSPEQVTAELEFIEYLRASGIDANEILLSKKNKTLEVIDTPWGRYEAAAFVGVPGVQLDKTELSDDTIYGYGRSLGLLHSKTASYNPSAKRRWNWADVLDWAGSVLTEMPDEAAALNEIDILRGFFSKLPSDNSNYGLLHYDYETDNVFFDASANKYYSIDFDDAMYHWFAMDIEQAVESIIDDIDTDRFDHLKKCFVDGYRSAHEISDEMLSMLPVFGRFANLYGYARIKRSIQEKCDNEPEWMTGLRGHLDHLLVERSEAFGNKIVYADANSDAIQGCIK